MPLVQIKTEPEGNDTLQVKTVKPVKTMPVKVEKPPPKIPTEPTATTEERIVGLLVPDMGVGEVMGLVRKMKQAGMSESDEFSTQEEETKTAPRFICEYCGNIDQNNFITDYARGDTICKGKDGMGCGTVVQDHIVHEGSAYRKFEGEEDKSHHGPAPNKLFSSGHNLRTMISVDGEAAAELRRAADFVEMNLSQMGKDERRTRIGYKDQMKRKACNMIDHVAGNLDLHEIVVARAKQMFAEFRDVREHVHQFEAIVAGCVLSSYLDTKKEVYLAQMKKHKLNAVATKVDEKKLHPFQCQWCQMKFNAKRALQFHNCERKPDAKDAGPKESNGLKPIEAPDETIQPIIETKGGKKWFKCPVCQRMYERRDVIEGHFKRHVNQSAKRKRHIDQNTVDSTRLTKTKTLASANPSVQVNAHEKVLFRGSGRRPWLQQLQKEMK